jgi:hypothetical protein
MSIDYVIQIEPMSFLSLSQHEIIHNLRNANSNTSSSIDAIMKGRVTLVSPLLNDTIFKASRLTLRQILSDKHNKNMLSSLFYMTDDTFNVATNTLTVLRSIYSRKSNTKTSTSDSVTYDINYSCTSLAHLWHLLPKNDTVDMIIAASMLRTLVDKGEIKNSNVLQTAGLVAGIFTIFLSRLSLLSQLSVSQVALRLLEYYDDHHHQLSFLLMHTMINSTSSTVVMESCSYLFKELFNNWRGFYNYYYHYH